MDRAQNYTCSQCLRHYCFDESCTDEDGNTFIEWCDRCEKHYCKECMPSNECTRCNRCFCHKCDALEKVCEDNDCEVKLCNECTLRCTCIKLSVTVVREIIGVGGMAVTK